MLLSPLEKLERDAVEVFRMERQLRKRVSRLVRRSENNYQFLRELKGTGTSEIKPQKKHTNLKNLDQGPELFAGSDDKIPNRGFVGGSLALVPVFFLTFFFG